MTPGDIQVLIEIHAFPYLDQAAHFNHDDQHNWHFIHRLVRFGLIALEPRCPSSGAISRESIPYIVTEKSKCFIEALCLVPQPTPSWEIKL